MSHLSQGRGQSAGGGDEMMEDTGTDNGRHAARWRIALWSAAALILMLPLIAMQITDEVNWDVTDFAVFATLLAGAGIAFELATRLTANAASRAAVAVAIAATFLLIWVNGAVGIIGSANDRANLMYGVVIAIGITGAIAARFRPQGMARAMLVTAVAQVLVALIALAARLGTAGPNWPMDLLVLTGLFTALWLLSAWLFRKAARED